MFNEILLSIIQGATEFLPISSSGHLALISNIISSPNLFFFVLLHLSSLLAVIFFLRKDIFNLLTFKKTHKKLWIYLILATIPGALFGFLFNDFIEKTFSSYIFLSIAFIFTGTILFLTRFVKKKNIKLNTKNTLIIGLMQIFALFPGISRSGTTISTAIFQGINKEQATKFSFMLFIPLSLGAFILEFLKLEKFFVSLDMLIGFVICFITSLFFLNVLVKIIKNDKFWIFSIYCWLLGLISLFLFIF